MRVITYHGLSDVRVTDVPEPEIQGAHDVLVDIEMTGICGTDHKIIEGKLDVAAPGTILGHEGVGTMLETGPGVTTVRPGTE
jgi:threonine dehydrogenase-like Zn-dependent dehydrogenase